MQLIKKNKTALITSVAALALATTSLIALADARPHHRKSRHPVAVTAGSTTIDDRYAHVQQGAAPMTSVSRRSQRKSGTRSGTKSVAMNATAFGSPGLVDQARRYIGSNPTSRSSLWCARFLNMLLEQSGHSGTGSDMASSFASFGRRVPGPQVGAIAVMWRGQRGGHVGIVSGIDEQGNPIVISGNYNGRVAEHAYPRGRIYAYVMP